MLAHAEDAIRYLGDATAADLEHDGRTLSALLWQIAIVGEAASALKREHGLVFPGLPLQAARSMRNLLLHNYPEIDVEVVAQTVREDFPPLITQTRQLLRNTPE